LQKSGILFLIRLPGRERSTALCNLNLEALAKDIRSWSLSVLAASRRKYSQRVIIYPVCQPLAVALERPLAKIAALAKTVADGEDCGSAVDTGFGLGKGSKLFLRTEITSNFFAISGNHNSLGLDSRVFFKRE